MNALGSTTSARTRSEGGTDISSTDSSLGKSGARHGHATHETPADPAEPVTRKAQKARTRDALIQGALDILSESGRIDSLSIRELTRRAGVVPAAFYRHFDSLESLQVTLLEQSLEDARTLSRELQTHIGNTLDEVANNTPALLTQLIVDNPTPYRMLTTEGYLGAPSIRQEIEVQLDEWERQLSIALARFPESRSCPADALQAASRLIMWALVHSTTALLHATVMDNPDVQTREIERKLRSELEMVAISIRNFRAPE